MFLKLFLKQVIDKNLYSGVEALSSESVALVKMTVTSHCSCWTLWKDMWSDVLFWSRPNVTLVSLLRHGWPACPPAAAQLAPRPCRDGDGSIVCLAARHASGHRPTGQQVTGQNHQARARLTILLTHQDGNGHCNLQKWSDEANEGWVKEKKIRGLSLTVRGYPLSRTGWHLWTDVQLQTRSPCQECNLKRSWAFLRAGSC